MKRWIGFEGPASITCQSPKLVPLHLQPAPLFPLLLGGGGRAQSNPAGPCECTVLSAAMCPSLKPLRACQKNGAVPKELGIGQLLVTHWLRCVQVVGIIAVCRTEGRNPINSSQVSVICFPFATINHNSVFHKKSHHKYTSAALKRLQTSGHN